MRTLFEIPLRPIARRSRGAAGELYGQLREAIQAGRLPAGTQLPVTRSAAQHFGVSRNTAAAAYARLLCEGLAVSRRGAGTFVAERPAVRRRTVPRARRADARVNPVWLRDEVTAPLGFWRDAPGPPARPVLADFRPALIDARLFPMAAFRRVSATQLRRLERRPAVFKSPQGNPGHYPLRRAIAAHVAQTRAVVCEADDLLVTNGAQQAFDLLARVLVVPGRTVVAVEDPGYPPLRAAFAAAGARLAAVPVDAEGLIVEALPRDARVICVCPSHQFPTGVSLSAARRRALLAFARRHGAVIVEDDYDGEFRYEGSPLEALRTAGSEETVCYVGTFSKSMLPSLRLGFLVAPRWLLPALVTARNCSDWHSPLPLQMAVAEFMAAGHLLRHVRKVHATYQARRALLLSALQARFATQLAPLPSWYGMHIAAEARGLVDLEAVSERLRRQGVQLHAFGRFSMQSRRQGLVFGFGGAGLPEIRLGLEALHRVLAA